MAVIEINKDPSARQLRQFAGIWLGFFAVAGAVVAHRTHSAAWAGAVWAIAGAVGAMGLARPPWIRPVYLGMCYAALPIGWVVSHVLLAGVYYLVITPIGLVMRLCGRDPMCRGFDAGADSYWVARRATTRTDRYFRQY